MASSRCFDLHVDVDVTMDVDDRAALARPQIVHVHDHVHAYVRDPHRAAPLRQPPQALAQRLAKQSLICRSGPMADECESMVLRHVAAQSEPAGHAA